jgi:hypothetical protein
MSPRLRFAALASTLALAACHAAPPAPNADPAETVEDVSATRYRELFDVLRDEGEREAYVAFGRRLGERFDQVCGDTFCGGDYADLEPVRLACSATEKTAKMRECLWTFGGSYVAVNGATGALDVTATTFACRFPVGVKASTFLATMTASADPLFEPIPGRDATVYDALLDCLRSSAPLPLPTPGRFVDAFEALGEADLSHFLEARRALADRFDALCGDSFCEGEFSSFAPLGLRCSVDPATGELGACTWPFAATAPPRVAASTGRVSLDPATFACRLPFSGNAGELFAALAGAADPLFAPLPGGTTTVNDALIDCL